MPNRLLSRAELRVVMKMLRELLTKDVSMREQVKTHRSWKVLTESFNAVKDSVPLAVMLCLL